MESRHLGGLRLLQPRRGLHTAPLEEIVEHHLGLDVICV